MRFARNWQHSASYRRQLGFQHLSMEPIGCERFSRFRGSHASGAIVGRSIEALAGTERVAFYRNLSLEALKRAQAANQDDQKVAYLEIAQRWSAIADEVEQILKREAELATHLNQPEAPTRPL